jgi:lysozyme family protein
MKKLILYLFTFILVSFRSVAGDFDKFFPELIKAEGIKFTVVKYDNGGATKFGITLQTYKTACKMPLIIAPCDKDKNGRITSNDLRLVTLNEVKPIYKNLYWNTLKADKIINQGVANIWTDLIVNSGTGFRNAHIKAIQKIVKVAPDGIVGVKTIEAINKSYAPYVFDEIFKYRKDFYKSIVKKNRSQKRFLNGWNRRLNNIYKFCQDEKFI